MPCGGGDIGLNVWVENNELLFYISRSGSLDENNCLLKSGRIRVKLTPNPFINSNFSQQLNLRKGFVDVNAGNTNIRLWVNVFSPVIHVDIYSKKSFRQRFIMKTGAIKTVRLERERGMPIPINGQFLKDL